MVKIPTTTKNHLYCACLVAAKSDSIQCMRNFVLHFIHSVHEEQRQNFSVVVNMDNFVEGLD